VNTGRRSWWTGCWQAAAVLYLPQLLVMVLLSSHLLQCSEGCLAGYLKLFPVMPGLLAGLGQPGGDSRLFALAGLVTLGLLALLTALMRGRGRTKWFVAVPVALLSGGNGMLAAIVIRGG